MSGDIFRKNRDIAAYFYNKHQRINCIPTFIMKRVYYKLLLQHVYYINFSSPTRI